MPQPDLVSSMLATLRRGGPPYELTPSDPVEQTMVTSGAVTEHLANEARLLEPLTASERSTLAGLLARLGASLGV